MMKGHRRPHPAGARDREHGHRSPPFRPDDKGRNGERVGESGGGDDGVEVEAALEAGEKEGREQGTHPAERQDEPVAEGRGVQEVGGEEGEQRAEGDRRRHVKSCAGRHGPQAGRVREVPPARGDGAEEALGGRATRCRQAQVAPTSPQSEEPDQGEHDQAAEGKEHRRAGASQDGAAEDWPDDLADVPLEAVHAEGDGDNVRRHQAGDRRPPRWRGNPIGYAHASHSDEQGRRGQGSARRHDDQEGHRTREQDLREKEDGTPVARVSYSARENYRANARQRAHGGGEGDQDGRRREPFHDEPAHQSDHPNAGVGEHSRELEPPVGPASEGDE